jgi:hypothetical protein
MRGPARAQQPLEHRRQAHGVRAAGEKDIRDLLDEVLLLEEELEI